MKKINVWFTSALTDADPPAPDHGGGGAGGGASPAGDSLPLAWGERKPVDPLGRRAQTKDVRRVIHVSYFKNKELRTRCVFET